MTRGLSKSRLMDARQCPRKLWLKTHRPELIEYTSDTETRFRIGFEVGEQARALFPDGLLIDASDLSAALQQTRTALREQPDRPLFEAAFERDGVLVRVDLLLPEPDGAYRLVEVKASTRVKDHHRADGAIQSWVVRGSCTLSGTAVAHVNNRFVYAGDGDYRGLLSIVPVDEDILPLLAEVPDWIAQARADLAGDEPAIEPGPQCSDPYDCPFQAHCMREQPQTDHPLDTLPRLGGWRKQGLEDRGIEDIRNIPEDYPLTDNQRRIADAIRSGRVEHGPDAARIVRGLGWPRYYLDFETTQCAVPIWPGTRPYQPLPVQWSCHVEWWNPSTAPDQFLFDREAEPLRAFAESLIVAVNQPCTVPLTYGSTMSRGLARITTRAFGDTVARGPILVYNAAFEKRILNELAEALPDLAPALRGIRERIVDLLPIVRAHYYHPAMHGSWSLKAVLPTIAPQLCYDALDIGDGHEASEAWRERLHPETGDERREALRKALTEYCSMDTWAMVVMVQFLGRNV